MTKMSTAWANKTYEAEHAIWDGVKAAKYRDPIGIWRANEIAKALGIDIPIKRSPTKNRSGHYYAGTRIKNPRITLGTWAGEWVVLHELAHAVAWPLGDQGHGPLFRRAYVDIVRRQLGDYWADRLLASFDRHGLVTAKMLS